MVTYKKKPIQQPTPPNHDPLDVVNEVELLIRQHKELVAFLFATGAKPSDINAAVRTLGGLCKILADIKYDLGRSKKILPTYEEPIYSPVGEEIKRNLELSKTIAETEKEFFALLQEDFPGIELEPLYPPPLENPEEKKYPSH